jgi:predicted CXXCH cytochrome family protein
MGASIPVFSLGGPRQDPGGEAPRTLVPMEDCVTSECHSDVKRHAFLHGPLYVDACDACHALEDVEEHTYSLSREPNALCVFCHELGFEGRMHEPVEAGECLACHDPHGSESGRILRDGESVDVCGQCHADMALGAASVHGPVVEGECGVCHEPHASVNPKLLVESGNELCFECHEALEHELESANLVHAPVLDDCRLCHDPHASDQPKLLRSVPEDLCTSCHDDIGTLVDSGRGSHGAVTSERSCLNCHDPHASNSERLLRRDAMSLCFECHDEPIEREGGGTIRNMKSVFEESLVLHGPVLQRNCVACHMIHGGGERHLLAKKYEANLYGRFDDATYSLCFSCHDRGLALDNQADQVTGFRNGSLNLHFVHVNRKDKSHSCHVCHDPHGSNNSLHLRDAIPFGPEGWPLPIAWRGTETGGSCAAGCHRAYAYDRRDPVVYPVQPMGERDWSGGKYVPPVAKPLVEDPPETAPDDPQSPR